MKSRLILLIVSLSTSLAYADSRLGWFDVSASGLVLQMQDQPQETDPASTEADPSDADQNADLQDTDASKEDRLQIRPADRGRPVIPSVGAFHGWSPTIGNLRPYVDIRSGGYCKKEVHGQNNELGWYDLSARGFLPIMQNEQFEWSIQPIFHYRKFQGSAWLSRAWTDMPSELYNVGLGTTVRARLENDWIIGGHFSLTSPSDKPFASGDEFSVSATPFVQIPLGDCFDGIVMLQYDNNRNFAKNIPLPGLAVHYYPDRTLDVFGGFPYSSIRWEPVEKLTLSGRYMFPRDIFAEARYQLLDPLAVYLSFEWDNDRFMRHDRNDRNDRLFYYEKRVSLGMRWDITKDLYIDAAAGWGFDRFWYEGEDWGERDRNRFELEDAPFGMIRAGLRF